MLYKFDNTQRVGGCHMHILVSKITSSSEPVYCFVFSVQDSILSPQIGKIPNSERERKYKNKYSGMMGQHIEQCWQLGRGYD